MRWHPHRRGLVTVTVTALAGTAMLVPAAVTAPAPAQPLVAAAALLVLASLTGPLRFSPVPGGLAAGAVVIVSAMARPGSAVLAIEGLLILCYLLLLDAPRRLPWRDGMRWLRQQAAPASWAAGTTAALLLVLGVPVPVSAWLVVGGIGAAVCATLTALPRRPPGAGKRHTPVS